MGSIDKACISGFLCRLCSEMHRTVIHIYGDQGRKHGLVEKINGYLPITISPTDPLPKTICETCLRRVEQHYELLLRLARYRENRSPNRCRNRDTTDRQTRSSNRGTDRITRSSNRTSVYNTARDFGVQDGIETDRTRSSNRIFRRRFLRLRTRQTQATAIFTNSNISTSTSSATSSNTSINSSNSTRRSTHPPPATATFPSSSNNIAVFSESDDTDSLELEPTNGNINVQAIVNSNESSSNPIVTRKRTGPSSSPPL